MGRRAAGEGSIHQRSRDGKWCAVLDLGYVKSKRVRRTRTADTQEEAARLLHQLRNEFERGATNIDRRTPLKAWAKEWIVSDVEYRASVGQLRQSTAASYERLVRCHVVPHLGHIKLFDLDARTIQRAYQAMLDDLAPSSVSKVHQILRSMLGAAVRDGILVVNPCERATPPAVPRNEVEPLTLDDVKRILAASEDTRDHALWAVMAYCGLRLGEALALRKIDVHLEVRTLRVERTLGQHASGLRFGPPKSNKGRRTVPLVDDVVTALQRHRVLVAERRLAAKRWDEDCDALFPSEVGTWQYPRNVQRRFRRMRKKLGLPDEVRPHTLRHTYASLLFEAGVELAVVQELLGHADLATTRDIYIHLTDQVKKTAGLQLQARLRQ